MAKKQRSFEEQLADAIYTKLNDEKYFTRKGSRIKFKDAFCTLYSDIISLEKDAKLDTNTVIRYNKAELKKDLIKQIKSGKADAARILADLDNMRNNTEEYLIITVDYSKLPDVNVDKLLDEEAEKRDKRSFFEDDE